MFKKYRYFNFTSNLEVEAFLKFPQFFFPQIQQQQYEKPWLPPMEIAEYHNSREEKVLWNSLFTLQPFGALKKQNKIRIKTQNLKNIHKVCDFQDKMGLLILLYKPELCFAPAHLMKNLLFQYSIYNMCMFLRVLKNRIIGIWGFFKILTLLTYKEFMSHHILTIGDFY